MLSVKMALKPCRIIGHELIINKIQKYSTPANDEFWAKLAAILDFDAFYFEEAVQNVFHCVCHPQRPCIYIQT